MEDNSLKVHNLMGHLIHERRNNTYAITMQLRTYGLLRRE